MDYTRVKIFLREEETEQLAFLLEDFGVPGVIVETPEVLRELLDKKNSYDWDYIDASVLALENIPASITFYLEDSLEEIDHLDEILEAIQTFEIKRVEIAGVSDEDWKDNWKQYFKTTKVTDRIIVKPTWESYSKKTETELVIELDPGMAFGTGTHATTSMCLVLLEEFMKSDEACVIDIGCGSGILSIGAALLGAQKVLAMEIDPVAVSVAKENVSANHVETIVEVKEGDFADGIPRKGQIVVANLTANLVCKLARLVAASILDDGLLIVSGILKEQNDVVLSCLRDSGFSILKQLEKDGWCAIATKVGGAK